MWETKLYLVCELVDLVHFAVEGHRRVDPSSRRKRGGRLAVGKIQEAVKSRDLGKS